MKEKMWILVSIPLFIVLAGCSSEPRHFTVHEPGVYKGAKDQLVAKEEHQELIDRLKMIQTDR